MKQIEMAKILGEAKLLFGFMRVDQAEIHSWFNYFGSADPFDFRNAMMAACKSSKFFPTPGEVQKALEAKTLPPSLMMTPEEALLQADNKKLLLIRDAVRFANRAVVQDPTEQYDSLEELERANRIFKATWEREFKNRFARKQADALRLVKTGLHPKAAIVEVVSLPGSKKVLDGILAAAQLKLGSNQAIEATAANTDSD